MSNISEIYGFEILEDSEACIYAISNLARVGIAASDSSVDIDLTKGGFDTLFEQIAMLANTALDRMHNEAKAREKEVAR